VELVTTVISARSRASRPLLSLLPEQAVAILETAAAAVIRDGCDVVLNLGFIPIPQGADGVVGSEQGIVFDEDAVVEDEEVGIGVVRGSMIELRLCDEALTCQTVSQFRFDMRQHGSMAGWLCYQLCRKETKDGLCQYGCVRSRPSHEGWDRQASGALSHRHKHNGASDIERRKSPGRCQSKMTWGEQWGGKTRRHLLVGRCPSGEHIDG